MPEGLHLTPFYNEGGGLSSHAELVGYCLHDPRYNGHLGVAGPRFRGY